ncbi:MAG: hypothetical protein E7521_03720 [Ruminococcaceae bacterium]|nr:hypothetical protein [Oscillospiraceae bacterium]
MKKLLCLVMAIVMLFSVCGCLGRYDNVDDIRGEITSETENSTLSQESEDSQPEFSLGKTSNNVYTNEFLGLSCTLPSEWNFYSDEQILELNNITKEYIDEDVSSQLEKATIIYDMYAQNNVDNSNVNVNLERLNPVQAVTLDLKTALVAQTDAIISTYQNMGYTDVAVNYENITVDGKKFDALRIEAKIQGYDFYGIAFAFIKNSYLANVTVTSLQTDKTNTILKCFTLE